MADDEIEVVACTSLILASVGAVMAISYSRKRKRCLLYTSDAADDLLCVDLGGRRCN